ncbi:MAG: fumarylacetoacetate hydrolase family protein [Planctomycetales bacterium]|nr:fumarylacetoacetate hydrolase family protein [Planctomycetales bacterium]
MSLSPEAIEEGVAILRRGRGAAAVAIGELPTHCAPSDLADAMRLQRALNRRLTQEGLGAVVGSKIGCTTRVMQEYLGMTHPCSGAIFQSTVRELEGRFDFGTFLHVGVECEIAAVLNAKLSAADAPHSMASVSRAVESVHAAIEIVDDRYEDFVRRIPGWKTWVADNFFGAGVVLGPPQTRWQSLDLADVRGVMRINGREVGAGYGRDIINGHPLEALAWIANDFSSRGEDLPAGWLVMLGSVVQTKWVAAGDTVEVELEGLGAARATF